jgi:hypothetical protein
MTLDELKNIFRIFRQNLSDLQQKAAKFGILHIPTPLINEIRETQTTFDSILNEIRKRPGFINFQPYDDPYTFNSYPNSNPENDSTPERSIFQVNYGSKPSNASIRTKDQFILLEARAGSIEDYMINIVKEVLIDIDKNNIFLEKFNQGYQQFMLRAIWFDDKHGNIVLHIDLLHDSKFKPCLSVNQIQTRFHDDRGWYGRQGTSVKAEIFPVVPSSDSFFALSSEFYQRDFQWI